MNCILTGASLSASDALRWGLINQVVPQTQLMDAAMQMARNICECSPVAISASREVVYRGLDQTIDFPGDAWNMNDNYISIVELSADAQDGMLSFLEKRKPAWRSYGKPDGRYDVSQT